MKRRRWPTLLPFFALATSAALLAWHVEKQLHNTGRPAVARTAPAPEPAAATAPFDAATAVAPVDIGRHLDEVTARNLFSVDRKPPPEAESEQAHAQPEEPPPAPSLDAKLSGIVLAGERSIVVLTDTQDGTVHRLRRGDSHRGWTLVRVSGANALFRQGDQDTRLDLRFSESSGVASRPQARPDARPDARPAPQPLREDAQVEAPHLRRGVLRDER